MHEENCDHLLAHLSEYLDGEASAAICALIEEHLTECDDCQVVVDTLRKTVNLYHTLPQPSMPEEVRERMYKSLDLTEFFAPEDSKDE